MLEAGGRLGFRGIAVSEATVSAANETLDLARITNRLVQDYAIRMGVRDVDLVQSLFNTPREKMEHVDMPPRFSDQTSRSPVVSSVFHRIGR